MSQIYIFAGPTLCSEEAMPALEATYLPPVSQGDVLRVMEQKPKAIGIIDGYFERMPSVWHKEILLAMSRGIHVFGSASLGALRAAELSSFGMVGIGAIFEAFRAGVLEDDDEVTIIHGPSDKGYPPLSEAMVNIRSTLAVAQEQNIIDSRVHQILIELAKDLFYPFRSYPALLELARQNPDTAPFCDSLKQWVLDNRIDQKKSDALAMLRAMNDLLKTGLAPKRVKYSLHHTVPLQQLQNERSS